MTLLFPLVCAAADTPASTAYGHPELLVSTEWLQANLQNENLIVLDTRNTGYTKGHIPGAILFDCEVMRSANIIKPRNALELLLNKVGLREDATIVIYDNGLKSRGSAGWAFWLFEYLGCRDVRVLNGGWYKWMSENRSLETAQPPRRAGKFMAKINKKAFANLVQTSNASQNADAILIDARGDAEYNGWALDGTARGGHIPGALNIDYSWFYKPDQTMLSASDIKTLLKERNISQYKRIIIYGSKGSRAGLIYFVLRLMGYPHCSVYDGGALEWSARTDLPMDKLPRYKTLVYAKWVKDLIDGKNPPTYKGKRFVIIETRYTGFSTSQPGEIERGAVHIPGAIVVHPCYFESGNDVSKYYPKYTTPEDGNLMPDKKLQEALAALGITHDTTVVVYGSGKIIPMTSGRVGWALMYAGVEDVRILNGGLTAWTKEGFPVVESPASWKPVPTFGTKVVRSEFLATTDYVHKIVAKDLPSSVLVDVRKIEEYIGKECPYPFFDKKGHIPGSVFNGDYWVLIDKNDDTWRSYTEIKNMWENLGITPAVEPVFYCGTAWRSTVGFFHAWLMGFERMKNYDDSFYGWSFNSSNPIAVDSN
jgi:thiosulfate/3-mercaptopyruvate sulfurtransferase